MRTLLLRSRTVLLLAGTSLIPASLSTSALAATLCVNPGGSGGCYSTIQSAVNAAAAKDVINVGPGTYMEGVTIGIPLSLVGTGEQQSIINASGQGNGVLIDGYTYPGLHSVTVSGFTVENAQWEGILAVSTNSVTISKNQVINNDAAGPVFTGLPGGCPGQPGYETDESGDCGGAIHIIGTSDSVISDNVVTGNADGVLISDETAVSQGNLVTGNTVVNNPLDCGIVLASHPPVGFEAPPFATHFGVFHNIVSENLSMANGVQIGGSGVGLFSDGNGQGRVSENVVTRNSLVGNGLGGVALHSHVGPAFGLPADDMNGNSIIGNYIAKNLADLDDTATPGPVGININSGAGGTPINGTLITNNVITDEQFDVAVNTPGLVELHQNDLLYGHVGVANVCAYDNASICTGAIDADENYWGCSSGPDSGTCSSAVGASIRVTPWLTAPVRSK